MTRYAIYYAPEPASGLWQRASAWLGRDAASGACLAQPELAGIAAEAFHDHTADPRHYGFHATLKAPFELAAGQSEAGLLAGLTAAAAGMAPFETAISPQPLGRFLALRPVAPCPRIQHLHEQCVRTFEPFRAALSDGELARRRKAGLSAEQDRMLVCWGYPYVMEHFRFHMTLTGSIIDDGLRKVVLEAATAYFAADAGPHRFAGLSLFRQADRSAPFDLIAQAPFAD